MKLDIVCIIRIRRTKRRTNTRRLGYRCRKRRERTLAKIDFSEKDSTT